MGKFVLVSSLIGSLVIFTGCPTDDGGSTDSMGSSSASDTGNQDPKAFCGDDDGVIPWTESNNPFNPGGIFGSCCDGTKVGDLAPGDIGEVFWPCQVGLFCDFDQNSHPHQGVCDDDEPVMPVCGANGVTYNECVAPPHATPCDPVLQVNVCDSDTLEWCGCDPPGGVDICSPTATDFDCPPTCVANGLWCEPDGGCCTPPTPSNEPEPSDTDSGETTGAGTETEGTTE